MCLASTSDDIMLKPLLNISYAGATQATHTALLVSGHWRQVQWNPSNPDTLGTEESVLISEVS